MKIFTALLYIASFLALVTGYFAKDINHATLDAVLALFLFNIGRSFEKEAK